MIWMIIRMSEAYEGGNRGMHSIPTPLGYMILTVLQK